MTSKPPEDSINLQNYWLTLQRWWQASLSVFTLTITAIMGVTFLSQPVYQAESKLLLKLDRVSRITGIDATGDTLGGPGNVVSTEIEVLRSSPIILQTISSLGLTNSRGKSITLREFRKNLDISNIRGTDIIGIYYKSNAPNEAADSVNELTKNYLEFNRLSNRSEATAARLFIEQQIPKVQEKFQNSAKKLQNFRRINQIIDTNDEVKRTSLKLQITEDQLIKVRAEFSNSKARAEALQAKLGLSPSQALISTSINQSPSIQQVLKELRESETQLVSSLTRFNENSIQVAQLREKINNLQRLLEKRIINLLGSLPGENTRAFESALQQDLTSELIISEITQLSLNRQLIALETQYNIHKKRADELPQLVQTEEQLKLDLETARLSYESLSRQLQEAQIVESQNVGNVEIIEQARLPEKAIYPKKKLNLAAGLIIGTILSIITAFLLDLLDPAVKDAQEACDAFGYPLLGTIPSFNQMGFYTDARAKDEVSQLPVKDAPLSPLSESYQFIYASLRSQNVGKDLKIITITSSVSGEGKSTVAANLALIFKYMGCRVLIVDADLYAPSQHRIWKLKNDFGLCNLSSEKKKSDAIQDVQGIHVLPSGTNHNLQSNYHLEQKLQSLINSHVEDYEVILFDTPPLQIKSDALLLKDVSDGFLVVVSPNVVDVSSISRSRDALLRSQVLVLGQIMNNVHYVNDPDFYTSKLQAYKKYISQKKYEIS